MLGGKPQEWRGSLVSKHIYFQQLAVKRNSLSLVGLSLQCGLNCPVLQCHREHASPFHLTLLNCLNSRDMLK